MALGLIYIYIYKQVLTQSKLSLCIFHTTNMLDKIVQGAF